MNGHRYQDGFTLIELVVAGAIAGILLGAALDILGIIAGDRARLAATRPAERGYKAGLIETLRSDLACASAMQIEKDRLVLQTYYSLDAVTLQPLDRPSQVIYQLAKGENISWLLRTQQFTDDPAARGTTSLLAVGVKHLDLERLNDSAKTSNRLAGSQDPPQKIQVLPRRVCLAVDFDDSAGNIRQVICLR